MLRLLCGRYPQNRKFRLKQKKPISAVTTDTGKIAARLQLFIGKRNP
jgi:hypothetical protein